MMKSVIYSAIVALTASAQTVEHKHCASINKMCIVGKHTEQEVAKLNPGVDCHNIGKCCDGLVCVQQHKYMFIGQCKIPIAPTSSSHPSPSPSPKCVHKDQVCGHEGTGIPPQKCCDKKNECRSKHEGIKGSVMTCQKKAPKCVHTGDQCGTAGTGKPTKKCCNKDSECRAKTEGIKGSVMTCQKKAPKCVNTGDQCGTAGTGKPTKKCCNKDAECRAKTEGIKGSVMTCQTKTPPTPPHPVCNKTTGYMGPVQIRTDDCAAKVNDTIIFNTTCNDVKFNKTSQWWIYFTTGCGMNTEFQLVNGEEQVSVCDGHMNETRAYFANDDISEANVTIFEHRHNYVDTFTINVNVSVDELSQIIVNQTEAAVEMIVGDYYLAVNGTQPMYSAADASENNTVFNIGVLSAFDVYYTN